MAETSPDAQGAAPEARDLSNGEQFITIGLSEPDTAPITNQRWLRDWLIMAVVENRTLLPAEPIRPSRASPRSGSMLWNSATPMTKKDSNTRQ